MNLWQGWTKHLIQPPENLLPRKTFDEQQDGCISEAWLCLNSPQEVSLPWYSKLCNININISETKHLMDFVSACLMGTLSSWRGYFCSLPLLIFMQSGSSFSPHGESKSKYRLRWGCYTVAFLRHQDSILSVGEWYPLELAKNWVKQIATAHVTMTSTPPMDSTKLLLLLVRELAACITFC